MKAEVIGGSDGDSFKNHYGNPQSGIGRELEDRLHGQPCCQTPASAVVTRVVSSGRSTLWQAALLTSQGALLCHFFTYCEDSGPFSQVSVCGRGHNYFQMENHGLLEKTEDMILHLAPTECCKQIPCVGHVCDRKGALGCEAGFFSEETPHSLFEYFRKHSFGVLFFLLVFAFQTHTF